MNIKQIKEKYTIIDYLGKPVKSSPRGFLYRCPWREDAHPSLTVTPNGKGWHDLSSGEHGNLIDLVGRVLKTSDLSTICQHFDSFSFPKSKNLDERKEKDSFTWFEVQDLQEPGLFAYLRSRGIDGSKMRRYLMEAHYSFSDQRDRYLYSLAFPNDLGGFELRSARFKGSTAPKGISTILTSKNASVVVFEGFMDFLSFRQLEGEEKHSYIVMNSIVHVSETIQALKNFPKVYLCLDNDDGGRRATAAIIEQLSSDVEDISSRILPFKDVNEYLQNRGE